MKKLYTIASLLCLGAQAYGAVDSENFLQLTEAIDKQNVARVEELASITPLTAEQKKLATDVAQKWVKSHAQIAAKSHQLGNDIAKSHGGPLLALLGGAGIGVSYFLDEDEPVRIEKRRIQRRVELIRLASKLTAALGLGLTAGSLKCESARTIAKWITGPVITALGLAGAVTGFGGTAVYLSENDNDKVIPLGTAFGNASLGVTALGAWLTASVWGKSHALSNLSKARRILDAVKNISVSE